MDITGTHKLHDKIPNKHKLISMFSHIVTLTSTISSILILISNKVQINETTKFDLCNQIQEKN
jgi:hypothetical protein